MNKRNKIISLAIAFACCGLSGVSAQEAAPVAPGDTIQTEAPTANASRKAFNRGIKMHTCVPKGQWVIGANLSFSEYGYDDYQVLIIDGISGNGYSVKASPMFLYIVKDNIGVGGRGMYSRSLNKIDNADITLGDDLSFGVDHLYQLKHSYSIMAIMRNYISLGHNRRFALFSELQLGLGGSQSNLVTGTGATLSGTHQSSFDVQIGVAPGIMAFVNNYMAIEVNVALLGFNYSKMTQTADQVYVGKQKSGSANFKVNIFSLGLGISFYI